MQYLLHSSLRSSSTRSIVPYQAFETQEGWVVIGAGTDAQFEGLIGILGIKARAEWRENEGRVKDRARLCGEIEAAMKGRTADEWMRLFEGAKFAKGKVRSVDEALTCPTVTGMIHIMEGEDGQRFRAVGSPIQTDFNWDGGTFPPRLGQHTKNILKEFDIN